MGEDSRAAARREFQEEIGTDKVEIVGDERGQYQYDFPPNAEFPAYVTDKTNYTGQCIHLFLGKFLGEDSDIRLEPTELVEYRWVEESELPALIEDRNYLKVLMTILQA
jgi:putative (di)nucleoside polyphosphate hydrolase